MSTILLIVVAVVLAATGTAYYLIRLAQARGARVITCPETRETAAVEVDAARAVLTSIFKGETDYQLSSCTRWPERADCGQECVVEIHDTPNHCLVRTVLADWYLGRNCVFCGKAFGEINWHDHKPGLYDPDQKKNLEWTDVRPELVYAALASFEPVCWDCNVAERFRLERPDLVIDRNRPSAGAH
jgi:hypothetical protein